MLLHNPFGPIFEKELRATSRRRRSYLLRVVYLGGMLLFLVLAYLGNGGGGGGIADRVRRQNELGRVFFICFTLFSTGAMAMIGAVLTSTAISSERLHKTLHVLLMTPITAWQIITGKLFSRLLIAFMLIGLSLPVLALVRLLGGVELEQMFGALALCTVTAIVSAAMGLFFSTIINRAYAAILMSYGSMFLLYLAFPGLFLAISTRTGAPPTWCLRLVGTVSPFLSSAFISVPGAPVISTDWRWCAAAQLVLAALLTIACALLLRRIQRREGAGSEPAAAPDPTPQAQAADPGPKKRSRSRRDVGNNPVLWREQARPLFGKRWQSIAACLTLVMLLLISYACFGFAEVLDDRELQFVYACLMNGVTWLVVSVLAATAIAQEKESDTWTLLLATPIAAGDIVVGKILGLCRRMLWPAALIAAHFSIFAIAGVISWVAAIYVTWIILSFNTVWIATGVLLSLMFRKVTLAVIVNLLLGIGFYAGIPLLLLIALQALDLDDDPLELYLLSSPYYYLTAGLDGFSPEYDAARQVWAPVDGSWRNRELLLAGGIAGLASIFIAALIARGTVIRFNRMVGRAPQFEPFDSRELAVIS